MKDETLKLGTKMREIPLKQPASPPTVSPARQAWLDIAECWEQLCCGLIDRHEFNLRWAEFMYKRRDVCERCADEMKEIDARMG